MNLYHCVLGCEQLMLMLVPSVVCAISSCCTLALPTATAKETKNNLKTCLLPSPACCFPRQILQKQSGTIKDDKKKSSQRMSASYRETQRKGQKQGEMDEEETDEFA